MYPQAQAAGVTPLNSNSRTYGKNNHDKRSGIEYTNIAPNINT